MAEAVRGADVIKRRFRIISRNVHREAAVRLTQNARDLLSRARGLAPQLESDLIESGDIQRRASQGLHRRWVFFDSPYAVVRHEDFYNLGPTSSAKRSPDGPIGRKFLSRPLEAQADNYVDNLDEGVNLAIRQSVRV